MDTIKKLDYLRTMIVMFDLICPVGFFGHFYQILTDTYVKISLICIFNKNPWNYKLKKNVIQIINVSANQKPGQSSWILNSL